MRLPLVCAPAPDEPQLSWLSRLAWENRCSVIDLLEHCGIAVPRRSDLALGLADPDLTRISEATSLAVDELRPLGMRHAFARAGETLRVPTLPTAPRGAAFAHAHLGLEGERGCLECLRERRGALDVHCLHRLSNCCVTHNLLLVNTIRPGYRSGERPLSTQGGPLGAPGAPGAPGADTPAWLSATTTLDIDWRDRGLATAIQNILAGRPARLNGQRIAPAATSRFLWCVVLLLARFIEPDDLDLDEPRRNLLIAFTERRPAKRQRTAEPGTLLRREPQTLAALAPTAWALMLSGNEPLRHEMLQKLVRRVNAPENRATTRLQAYYPRLPDSLRTELIAEMSAYRLRYSGRCMDRAGLILSRTRARQGVAPSHIPQMLWPTMYDTEFASLLPTLTRQSGRTLCSILLLRVGPCTSLKSAARLLGQRGAPSTGGLDRLTKLMANCPESTTIGPRIQALSAQLTAMTLHTDYAALRRRFEHCVLLEPHDAEEIVAAFADTAGLAPRADQILMSTAGRTALALWIWQHATHSRHDRSAKWGTGLNDRAVRDMATVTTRLLDPHRDELLDALEDYLDTPLREPPLHPLQ